MKLKTPVQTIEIGHLWDSAVEFYKSLEELEEQDPMPMFLTIETYDELGNDIRYHLPIKMIVEDSIIING